MRKSQLENVFSLLDRPEFVGVNLSRALFGTLASKAITGEPGDNLLYVSINEAPFLQPPIHSIDCVSEVLGRCIGCRQSKESFGAYLQALQ